MRFRRNETERERFERFCALHCCAEFCRGRENWCPLADLRTLPTTVHECRRLWAEKNGAAEGVIPQRREEEIIDQEDPCQDSL